MGRKCLQAPVKRQNRGKRKILLSLLLIFVLISAPLGGVIGYAEEEVSAGNAIDELKRNSELMESQLEKLSQFSKILDTDDPPYAELVAEYADSFAEDLKNIVNYWAVDLLKEMAGIPDTSVDDLMGPASWIKNSGLPATLKTGLNFDKLLKQIGWWYTTSEAGTNPFPPPKAMRFRINDNIADLKTHLDNVQKSLENVKTYIDNSDFDSYEEELDKRTGLIENLKGQESVIDNLIKNLEIVRENAPVTEKFINDYIQFLGTYIKSTETLIEVLEDKEYRYKIFGPGGIYGFVKDENGNPVEGVIVRTKIDSTDISDTTRADELLCGFYSLRQLDPKKKYDVTIEKEGYQTATFNGLKVGTHDFTIKLLKKEYPHLEVEYSVSPESISSIDEEVTVTLKIKGIGGKVEDLPPDILEKLPRKPLDVVLVIDKSGSMDSIDYPPDRMTAAKEAAKVFVNQLKTDDQVAVVSFTGHTTTDISFTSDKDSAKSKIDKISTVWAGTAIGEGIITALDVLEKSREDTVKTIVLLSDGANNRGTSPKTAANRAKERGIPIYTVGIGTVGGGIESLDESTLKEIASITGGEYLYAPDEVELKKVYEKMSTKVLNVAGLNVKVDVTPTPFFNVLKQEPSSLEFDVIPVDTEKVIEITGKLTKSAPNGKTPIIQRFTITYTDLITGERKSIIKGPIYVEFSGETEPSDVKIKDIEFKGKDKSYEDANVYHLSDDIKAEVEIKNLDDVTVKSIASLYEGMTGKGSTDSKETDKDSITHALDNGGVIGSYVFSDLLYYPRDTLTDHEDDDVYVVFDEEDDVDDEWYSSTGMYSPNIGKAVSLHPRSKKILEFAAIWGSGSSSEYEASENILHNTYNYIEYNKKKGNCNWKDGFTILDIEGKNSKGGVTGKPVGLCVDYSAAYISLLRSVYLPVLKVGFSSNRGGHSFTETYLNEKWMHADPTWNKMDETDIYLLRSFSNLELKKEFESGTKGKYKPDKLTTIKYAVGMVYPNPYSLYPQIKINLSEETTAKRYLFFENRAKSTDAWWNPFDSEKYVAEDFDIEIIDSGRLEVKVKNLRRDDTLDINELDYCTLTIKVPDEYAKTIDKGSSVTVPIKLKVDYETIDGEELEKDYIIKVRVER